MPVTVIITVSNCSSCRMGLVALKLDLWKHRLKTDGSQEAVTELYDLGWPVFSIPIVCLRDAWGSGSTGEHRGQALRVSAPASDAFVFLGKLAFQEAFLFNFLWL